MSFFGTLKGLLGNNKGKDIIAYPTGEIGVSIGGQALGPFGDIMAQPMCPLMQFDFVSHPLTAGVMNQQYGGYKIGSGTVGLDDGRAKLTTTSAASDAAVVMSNAIARYRAGQGIVARFTPVFSTPQTNNIQVAGMCAPTLTWTSNGAPITAATVGDGYFFGYNGTSFGIRHKNSRTGGADTWIPQASWNVDTCDGSGNDSNPSGFNWNPQFANVCQIMYPYLGYGDVKFYVQNANTGALILCHVIKYANSSQYLQLSNPNLSFFAQTVNTGAASGSTAMYVGCVGVFACGDVKFTGPEFGWNSTPINNGTGELPILSLRNATSVNGVPNRSPIHLRSISFSGDNANTSAYMRIRLNPTLTLSTFANAVYGTITGGSNGFILTSALSVATVDTAATAVSAVPAGASDVVFNACIARNTGYQIDLTPYDLILNPGNTWTFTMDSVATGNTVQVAINWDEDT